MARHNQLGSWGEKLAKEYLITKGYTVTVSNWRMNHLEIDIIAYKGDRIIFVEVKTRTSDFVDPLEAIDRKRMSHMVRAADVYVKSHNVPHEVQFDVIIIIGTPEREQDVKIEHFPDAFLPNHRSRR